MSAARKHIIYIIYNIGPNGFPYILMLYKQTPLVSLGSVHHTADLIVQEGQARHGPPYSPRLRHEALTQGAYPICSPSRYQHVNVAVYKYRKGIICPVQGYDFV